MSSLYLRSSCCLMKTLGTPITMRSSSCLSSTVFLNHVTKLPRDTVSSISPKTACHKPVFIPSLILIPKTIPYVDGLFHMPFVRTGYPAASNRKQLKLYTSISHLCKICGKYLAKCGKLASIGRVNIAIFTKEWQLRKGKCSKRTPGLSRRAPSCKVRVYAKTNVPTQKTPAFPRTWFYEAHGHPCRPPGIAPAPSKGPQRTV